MIAAPPWSAGTTVVVSAGEAPLAAERGRGVTCAHRRGCERAQIDRRLARDRAEHDEHVAAREREHRPGLVAEGRVAHAGDRHDAEARERGLERREALSRFACAREHAHVHEDRERLGVAELEAHGAARIARHHELVELEARLGEHALEREPARSMHGRGLRGGAAGGQRGEHDEARGEKAGCARHHWILTLSSICVAMFAASGESATR
jgi:hypothetical protein